MFEKIVCRNPRNQRYRPRGGQKTKWKTPSPNFEELIESITNMLFFLSEGSRKKSYEVSKLRGGGGGSWPKKLKKKN